MLTSTNSSSPRHPRDVTRPDPESSPFSGSGPLYGKEPVTREQQALVLANQGLAIRTATRRWKGLRWSSRVELDELRQVAYEALCRSVLLYRPESGFAFSTYATRAMDNAINRHVQTGLRLYTSDWELIKEPLSLQEESGGGHLAEGDRSVLSIGERLPAPGLLPDEEVVLREELREALVAHPEEARAAMGEIPDPCSGCGVEKDERTINCRACMSRHRMRRVRAERALQKEAA